jgi:DNA-directed RNA polymerase subunit RPC12/RpoP
VIVRCGACRTQFDVPGEGRFACPVCGSVNMVRGRAGSSGPAGAPPPGSMPPTGGPQGDDFGAPQPPPPPPPDEPSPKIECPECGFAFIVGDIAVAVCPMCSAEVPTGRVEHEEAD